MSTPAALLPDARPRVVVADFDLPYVRVAVTDFDMPFGSMVSFMIKWALASVPAIILLAALWAIVVAVISGFMAPTSVVS